MKLVTTTADLAPYIQDRSVAAPVKEMAKTGFRHIDLSMYSVIYKGSPWLEAGDGWKKEIEQTQKAAEICGLDFCQAHSPDGEHFAPGEERDALIKATLRSIEACGMLGIPYTVIHAGSLGDSVDEFVDANITFFKIFEDAAEKYGVDLLVENSAAQWNPRYFLTDGEQMRRFVQKAEMPRLHICWDTGHGNVQGCNQYDDVLAMGDELYALHVQDNFGKSDAHMMPMTGTTNYDRLIEGLLKVGYKGNFTFEGSSTIRRSGQWPEYRRDVSDTDRLRAVPLEIQQKQISVMYDIGKWMLGQYGIDAD